MHIASDYVIYFIIIIILYFESAQLFSIIQA